MKSSIPVDVHPDLGHAHQLYEIDLAGSFNSGRRKLVQAATKELREPHGPVGGVARQSGSRSRIAAMATAVSVGAFEGSASTPLAMFCPKVFAGQFS